MEACRKNIYLTEQYQYTYLTNSTNQIIVPESRGGSRGGGAPVAPPPNFGKNMICCRKIGIFYTKCPKNVRASLRSAQFFKCAPP